jgi:hypothetical protein
MTTTMAMMMTNVDNKAVGASTRHFYITLCNGEDNNNYGNHDDECQRQGFVHKHTEF